MFKRAAFYGKLAPETTEIRKEVLRILGQVNCCARAWLEVDKAAEVVMRRSAFDSILHSASRRVRCARLRLLPELLDARPPATPPAQASCTPGPTGAYWIRVARRSGAFRERVRTLIDVIRAYDQLAANSGIGAGTGASGAASASSTP